MCIGTIQRSAGNEYVIMTHGPLRSRGILTSPNGLLFQRRRPMSKFRRGLLVVFLMNVVAV